MLAAVFIINMKSLVKHTCSDSFVPNQAVSGWYWWRKAKLLRRVADT